MAAAPASRRCQTAAVFQTTIQDWHDFYMVTGGAAATLVGLLFVGLSLHLRVVVSRPEVRSLASVTLANFGLVLLIALFALIPQEARGFSYDLIISGAISFGIVLPSLRAASRSHTRTLRVPRLVLRFGISALAYAGAVAAGVLILRGSYGTGLGWLAVVAISLNVVSLRNSWDLLVTVGAARMDEAREQDDAPERDAERGRPVLPSDA